MSNKRALLVFLWPACCLISLAWLGHIDDRKSAMLPVAGVLIWVVALCVYGIYYGLTFGYLKFSSGVVGKNTEPREFWVYMVVLAGMAAYCSYGVLKVLLAY